MTILITDEPEGNSLNIFLDSTPDSPLSFEDKYREIDEAIEKGKRLYFEFEFGLDPLSHNFKDQMRFYGYSMALATFTKLIYEKYSEHIDGVFLYRGAGDFRQAIENQLEMREARDVFCLPFGKNEHTERLFALQILLEYFHRLAATLPDELSLNVLLNFKSIPSRARQAELLAAYTFPYIKPCVKGALVPFAGLAWEKGRSEFGYIGSNPALFEKIETPNTAILLPDLGKVDYEMLENALAGLEEVNYKIIPDKMLNESWHLIDELIVLEGFVSSEGKRMIEGFIAAGGHIKTMGGPCRTALSE